MKFLSCWRDNITFVSFWFLRKASYKQSQASHAVWGIIHTECEYIIIINIWDFFSNYTLLALNGTANPFSTWQLSRFTPLHGFKKYKTEPDHKLPDSIKWCDSLCFHFADAGRLRGKMWDTHSQRAAAAAAVGSKRQVSLGSKNRSALWWTGLKFTGPQDNWDPSQTSVSPPNRQWSSWDNRRGYTLSLFNTNWIRWMMTSVWIFNMKRVNSFQGIRQSCRLWIYINQTI